MASSATTNPDTLVTLKVNWDGIVHRFKLPLRDLGASTLGNKIRGALGIAPSAELLIERYSDSGATYVVLDPTNISVFKQLYRAAKAKQKLKLRITSQDGDKEEKMIPKPVTVEDEPEPSQPLSGTSDLIKLDEPAGTPSAPAPTNGQPGQSDSASAADLLDKSLAMAAREHKIIKDKIDTLETSLAQMRLNADDRHYANATIEAYNTMLDVNRKAGLLPAATSDADIAQAFTMQQKFTVCCNSCDRAIPDEHYHCATCDDGDFDLCQDCIDKGITCYGTDHWLIKRTIVNGALVSSTTERIASKPTAMTWPAKEPSKLSVCNCCLQELPEQEFIHCAICEDFDLCMICFVRDQHGHHPSHPFVPLDPERKLDDAITRRLPAGRGYKHSALCDGCDKTIIGVRHKCLSCPDWDLCNNCILNAAFIHPAHRFVPVYNAIAEGVSHTSLGVPIPAARGLPAVHHGICCDGPLCKTDGTSSGFIIGVRYKCTVCNDTDFCGNCEASPMNQHNKTHPLVKFKTPIRHVSITTSGEHPDGRRMPTMGDRIMVSQNTVAVRSPVAARPSSQHMAATTVQTVVDVAPSVVDAVASEGETTQVPAAKPIAAADLGAVFVSDTIPDGAVLPPSAVINQVFTMRNSGSIPWPAGCVIKYVGGDYMGHVDPTRPVALQQLVSSCQSTSADSPVAPGETFAFSVLLRTPAREGKFISYWRLNTPEGVKFGHRLWCDIEVKMPKPVSPVVKDTEEPDAKADHESAKTDESQLIIPKLPQESPVASAHEGQLSDVSSAVSAAPAVETAPAVEHEEDFEECGEDDEWADDHSTDGIITDDEYDVLNASDEEYLEEQEKLLKK